MPVDLLVFCVGLTALVAGVAVKDWPSALIVLGVVLMGIVVTARITGGKKE
jgi:uncharacterized integral membrane protein